MKKPRLFNWADVSGVRQTVDLLLLDVTKTQGYKFFSPSVA